MTGNHLIALDIAKRIKAIDKDIVTVIGGIHATLNYRDMAKHWSIDYVVVGEGEFTFLELVTTLQNRGDPRTVEGLAFRTSDDNIVVTPSRPRIEDLDSLPWPARHLFDMNVYNRNRDTKMITSRGCPYRCIYCSTARFHGSKFRAVSAERVIDEMEYLINTYKLKSISFADDIFTLDRQRTYRICQIINEKGLQVKWGCSTRVDRVDQELLTVMHKAGCNQIFYGIESVSQQVLDTVHKGFTVEQAKQAIRWTKEAGIDVEESFIIGLPCDTYKSVMHIADFIKETKPSRIALNILYPFPGTYISEHMEEFGIRILGNLCHAKTNIIIPMITTPNLAWSDLIELRVKLDKESCDGVLYAIELPKIV
jgi:radical SAM superfamily enzyme YgiQ (UPF0313 family)